MRPKVFAFTELLALLAILATFTFQAQKAASQEKPGMVITNGTDWTDTQGNPIAAHDGGIARFNDVFYWYGSSYAGNPQGLYDISAGPVWNGVQVYRSSDLVNWTYEGVALPRPEEGWGKYGATGRAHVLYNEKTQKYVMWYRWFLTMPVSFIMVAVADNPEGPFTPLGPREVGTDNGFASDMDVFQDTDGKAYLIYCDHETGATAFKEGANGRYAVRVDSLTDDYLALKKEGAYVFDHGAEAPALIKYKDKYIAAASGVDGWEASEASYAVAESPLGPYRAMGVMSEQNTWGSQITDLVYIEESDVVMVMCDMWWNPDKSDLNRSRYQWLPLVFDKETATARMVYKKTWHPMAILSE